MTIIPFLSRSAPFALDPAIALLDGESQGAAFDFENWRVWVRDRAVAGNNFLGSPADLLDMTRASDATYFDDSGVMQVAGPNVMRRSRVPETGRMGYLSEWSSTNLWAWSQPTGGTPGVIGAGGVLPTNWFLHTAAGLAVEILAIEPDGIEDGVPGVALRVYGTGNGAFFRLMFAASSAVTIGQTYTTSAYVRAVAGSAAGVVSPSIVCVNGGPTPNITDIFAPARMAQARYVASGALENVNPGSRRYPEFRFTASNGVSIDITILIGAAQFEQRGFVSSYIPTGAASALRVADNARINLSKLPWSTEHFCLVLDYDNRTASSADGYYRVMSAVTNGTNLNVVTVRRTETNNSQIQVGSAGSAGLATSGGIAGRNRTVIAVSSDGHARISTNGGAVAAGVHGMNLSILTLLGIAQSHSGLSPMMGHIHSLVLIPRNPTDLEMQGWSTLS